NTIRVLFECSWYRPPVCLSATASVVCSDECDDGGIGPPRCAVIGTGRGDRSKRCCAYRTPPSAARSTRSARAAGSRPVSTAAPGGLRCSSTRRRSGSTLCDGASPPRSVRGTHPSLPHLFLVVSWLQCRARL